MLASMRIVDGGHLSDEDVTEALCDRGAARARNAGSTRAPRVC